MRFLGQSYSGGATGASIGEACRGLGAAEMVGDSIGEFNGDGE